MAEDGEGEGLVPGFGRGVGGQNVTARTIGAGYFPAAVLSAADLEIYHGMTPGITQGAAAVAADGGGLDFDPFLRRHGIQILKAVAQS